MIRENKAKHRVLWDGECGFCRRSVEWLARHDRFGALEFQANQDADLSPQLRAACQESVHVIKSNGEILKAGRAMLFCLRFTRWNRLARIAEWSFVLRSWKSVTRGSRAIALWFRAGCSSTKESERVCRRLKSRLRAQAPPNPPSRVIQNWDFQPAKAGLAALAPSAATSVAGFFSMKPSRPSGPIVMRPVWEHLLFLHWDFAPEDVQKLLPAGLEVDTFQGRAYVGLVPFVMRQTRPKWAPHLGRFAPRFEDFAECNVRTYVTRNGEPGVWFFSLDAASLLATLAARAWFGLPYFKARMRFWRGRDGAFRYQSNRLWPSPKPAFCSVRYRVSEEAQVAESGSLDEWLVERYTLYSHKNGELWRGRVWHEPYRIQNAFVDEWRENCLRAAGFTRPSGAPHALYSRGVNVEVWELERA
jgi:uncharacterized protein YqjF (DUF2071 family)/predicted DCC family thiol-disulfide oxidoreductase YuxK